MDCSRTRGRLHAHLDGEIDATTDAAVCRHLEACPLCRKEYLAYQQLGFAVRRDATYHWAPERLADRIASALPAIHPRAARGRAQCRELPGQLARPSLGG